MFLKHPQSPRPSPGLVTLQAGVLTIPETGKRKLPIEDGHQRVLAVRRLGHENGSLFGRSAAPQQILPE
jgi:hypothetical protein